jgi:large subunit ribosomal protein L26e
MRALTFLFLGVAAERFYQPMMRGAPAQTMADMNAFAWQETNVPVVQWTPRTFEGQGAYTAAASGWAWNAAAFFSAFAAVVALSQKASPSAATVAALAVDGGGAVKASLSKDLRDIYSIRKMPLRVNDEVRVISGGYQGREGKVIDVDRKKSMVQIEELTRPKTGGKQIPVKIASSKVTITKLKVDEQREDILKRKGATVPASEAAAA